jgi:hypothetical protein
MRTHLGEIADRYWKVKEAEG